MGKLELKSSWSNSRVKTLRECPRKYYYQYFLSWEGWLQSAPDRKRMAYILKNMTNKHMWPGSIAHEVIEHVIKEYRKNKKWLSLESAQNLAIEKLRSGWKSSRSSNWKQNPKSINLFEDFYGDGLTNEESSRCKNIVLTSIENFYNSNVAEIIKSLDEEDWVSLEDFQSFMVDNKYEVSVKIDTAFKHDGKVYLIDYKTGKESPDVLEQLMVYAMYALKKGFAKRLSDIYIVPVYLMLNKEIKLQCKKQQILNQAEIIRQESKMLQKAHEHKDNEEKFRYTENLNLCKYCQFKQICDGSKR